MNTKQMTKKDHTLESGDALDYKPKFVAKVLAAAKNEKGGIKFTSPEAFLKLVR